MGHTYSGLGGIAYGQMAMYGSLNLSTASLPQVFSEPLSLAEVKSYLNVPPRSPVDSDEDAQLQSFISAAREQAEIMQGRDIVQKQWDLSLDYFLTYKIQLRAPLVSVDLVRYRYATGEFATLIENVDYVVDTAKQPGCIMPAYNRVWPAFSAWPSSAVLVRFTSGMIASDPFWADAGHRVKNGMKLLISAWYNNRLPFELGAGVVDEYPYTVTACLSYGSLLRAR